MVLANRPSGSRARAALLHPAAKGVLFVAALLPFLHLVWAAVTGNLGANPAEALSRATGEWTLRFLCLTLAVTPLRQLSGRVELIRFRRMLGLFTFFYGVLHLASYAWFDMGFVVGDIARDIVKRPFIFVGFAAFVLMVPLAATSFNRAIRALGPVRWQRLHRAVYAVAILALLHFWWMRAGKQDFALPSVYIVIVGLLLGWRIWARLRATALAKRSAHTPVRET